MADDVVRIDDEGRAECHAFLLVQDAEGVAQRMADIGEHREGQVVQLFLVDAPGVMHELAVGAAAEDDRVTIGEFAVQLAEGGNLGRADEGEILRPEEIDLPLVRIGVLVDLGKRVLQVGRNGRLDLERGELITNRQHGSCLLSLGVKPPSAGGGNLGSLIVAGRRPRSKSASVARFLVAPVPCGAGSLRHRARRYTLEPFQSVSNRIYQPGQVSARLFLEEF